MHRKYGKNGMLRNTIESNGEGGDFQMGRKKGRMRLLGHCDREEGVKGNTEITPPLFPIPPSLFQIRKVRSYFHKKRGEEYMKDCSLFLARNLFSTKLTALGETLGVVSVSELTRRVLYVLFV